MTKWAFIAGLFGCTIAIVVGFLKYNLPIPGEEPVWIVNQLHLTIPIVGLVGVAIVSFSPRIGGVLMLASAAGIFAVPGANPLSYPSGALLLIGGVLGLAGTKEAALRAKSSHPAEEVRIAFSGSPGTIRTQKTPLAQKGEY